MSKEKAIAPGEARIKEALADFAGSQHREYFIERLECNLEDYKDLPKEIRIKFLKAIAEKYKSELSILSANREESGLSISEEMKSLTGQLIHLKSHLLLKKNDLSERIEAYGKASFYGQNYKKQQADKVQKLTDHLNDLIIKSGTEKHKISAQNQLSARSLKSPIFTFGAKQPLREIKNYCNTDFN